MQKKYLNFTIVRKLGTVLISEEDFLKMVE